MKPILSRVPGPRTALRWVFASPRVSGVLCRAHYGFYAWLANEMRVPALFLALALGLLGDLLPVPRDPRRHPGLVRFLKGVVVSIYAIALVYVFDARVLHHLTFADIDWFLCALVFCALLLVAGLVEATRIHFGLLLAAWGATGLLLLWSGDLLFLTCFGFGSVLLATLGFLRPAFVSGLPSTNLAVTTAWVLVVAKIAASYYHVYPDEIGRIVAQPSIQALYTLLDGDLVGDRVRRLQVRFIGEGCRPGVFYLATSRDSFFIEYHEKEREVRVEDYHPLDNIEVDCARQRLYLGQYYRPQFSDERRILALDTSDEWAVLSDQYAISGADHTRLLLVPELGRLLVTTEQNTLHILDLAAGRELFRLDDVGKFAVRVGRTIAARGAMRPVQILGLDETASRVELRQTIPLDLLSRHGKGGVILDPSRPRVYVNCYLTGRLLALDTESRRQVGSLMLTPGLRHGNITRDGRILVVVGSQDGRVFFIDTRSLRVVESVYVGPHARWVSLSRDEKYAYVPSAAGGFRIRLPTPEDKGEDLAPAGT